MKKYLLIASIFMIFNASQLQAHCEIPCGIFDDAKRFDIIMEHARTIEKSMIKINELSNADDEDYHMITRWTVNKEKHAQEIQDIASVYFLAQRVKAPKSEEDRENYLKHLELLHQIIVAAMKTKQSTNVERVSKLREVTQKYKKHYFTKHTH